MRDHSAYQDLHPQPPQKLCPFKGIVGRQAEILTMSFVAARHIEEQYTARDIKDG